MNTQRKLVRRVAVTTALLVSGGALATNAMASGGAGHGRVRGTATIVDASGTKVGVAEFVENGRGTVHVDVKVKGLTPGRHGVHVHEVGSCGSATGPFSSAGSHHRAEGTVHPDHYGDLPNLRANRSGRGRLKARTGGFSLTLGARTIFDADGSAIVVHALEDQFDATNFGGPRVACGVISTR